MSEKVTEVVATPLREITRFDISIELTSKLASLVSAVLREDTEQKPIHIDLCSVGGDVHAGSVIADILESHGVPVTFFCGTYNYSMSAMFIQNSDFVRLCYPSSRFMFHKTFFSVEGSLEEMTSISRISIIADKRTRATLASAIGLSDKEVTKKLGGNDTFFISKEMLEMGEHGAIDGIIQTRVGDHTYLCQTRDGLKIIDTFTCRRGDIKNLPLWVKPE